MSTAVVQAMFVFQGFARKSQDFADIGLTQLQAALVLEPWAHKLALVQDITAQWKGSTVGFEYEVSEPFGAWLRTHMQSPGTVKRAALAELTRSFFDRTPSPLSPSQYRTVRAIS